MFLTAAQVAEQLGISKGTLTQICRNQAIKHFRTQGNRGRYRFKQEWVDEYVASQTVDIQRKKTEPVFLTAKEQVRRALG